MAKMSLFWSLGSAQASLLAITNSMADPQNVLPSLGGWEL